METGSGLRYHWAHRHKLQSQTLQQHHDNSNASCSTNIFEEKIPSSCSYETLVINSLHLFVYGSNRPVINLQFIMDDVLPINENVSFFRDVSLSISIFTPQRRHHQSVSRAVILTLLFAPDCINIESQMYTDKWMYITEKGQY